MKSFTLDKWQDEWLVLFETIDNEIVNTFWEASFPKNQSRPNQNSPSYQTERFMRDKYEVQKWRDQSAKNIFEFVENNQAANKAPEPPKPVEAPKPAAPVAPAQPKPAPIAAQTINLLDEADEPPKQQ